LPGDGRWATAAVGLTCLAALVVACYGRVLFAGEQFGFRDSAHFYYPLYARVQHEWAAGRLPLWEPGEDGGTPMLGTPMAAVLYPVKLIFALVPYPWGVRLYTVAHEVLAFWAMVALSRSWGVSRTGATLAGLSYAFGGPVLTDYFNIIYLVGAAWLPLGLRAVDGWLRLGRRSALVELSLVLAMQLLGGDPEAAYLTILCAFGYAFALARPRSAAPARPARWGLGVLAVAAGWTWAGPHLAPRIIGPGGPLRQAILTAVWTLGLLAYLASHRPEHRARLGAMTLGLAGSSALAIAVTAVQSFPILEHIATSVRWSGAGPSNLYDFSAIPCRAFEWILPNFFGTYLAGNRDWLSIMPPLGAHGSWPLTFYLGGLPFVLAVGASGFRDRTPWCAWLTAIAILSFWMSLGEFAGPGPWSNGETTLGGDRSLYGLLATLIPGFRLFRYPCKLLVFTGLALSALAGIGWDAVACGVGRRRTIVVAFGLLILTALTLATAAALHGRLVATLAVAGQSIQSIFGPFDAPGAVAELLRGLCHGATALALGLLVFTGSARYPGLAALAAPLLLTADLAIANASLVFTIPQADYDREPEVVRAIRAAERAEPSRGPFRVHRLPLWAPIGWSQVVSTHRLREFVNWEIDTIDPNFGLLHGVSYVITGDSQTESADYRRFFRPVFRPVDAQAAAALGVEPGRRVLYYPRRAFDLWGARYFILPSYPGGWETEARSYAAFLDQTELIYPDPAALSGPEHRRERERWLQTKDVQVRRNKAAFPRAWIVHDARLIRPLDESSPTARDSLLMRLGFADTAVGPSPVPPAADPRQVAYVETDAPARLAPYLPGTGADPTESVSVRYEGPTRVVLEAHLHRPGIIILADVFDRGWRLEIDGRSAPILRANLLMRGAAVVAGTHRLVYRYEPTSVRLGLSVSAAGLMALIALSLWAHRRPAAGRRPFAPRESHETIKGQRRA
jgi:hypothetical protein